jgi:hypothetical protein
MKFTFQSSFVENGTLLRASRKMTVAESLFGAIGSIVAALASLAVLQRDPRSSCKYQPAAKTPFPA